MKVSKPQQITLVLCLIIMPFMANAANLGRLNLLSSVGEPLNAEVEVVSTLDELDGLAASLASSDDIYIGDGVAKPSLLKSIKVSVLRKEGGQAVVKLTTDAAVDAPVLNVVLVLSWRDELLWREYTLALAHPKRLAPVVTSQSKVTPVAIGKKETSVERETKLTTKLVSNAAKSSVQQAPDAQKMIEKAAPQADSLGKVSTRRGDSLCSIAKRIHVQDVNLDQMLVGLFGANKAAFYGENMNRLRAGQTLQVPSIASLQSVNTVDAKTIVRAHTLNWNVYMNNLANVVSKTAVKGNTNGQANVGKITADADKQAEKRLVRDVVKVSKSKSGKRATQLDELAAKQNAINDAEEKAADLEKQISGMKDLLEIKNKAAIEAPNEQTE